ncbi:MAG: DUF2165 domain-containing protein [Rhodobacteraceae bacterium]|nr:DUF2165 domain-containing protein [Paracoccaceae bacterium]
MYETVLLLAQLTAVTAIAGWLSTGAWDNLVHPDNNELYTSQVMAMDRMKEEYPVEYARVAHRAITDRTIQKLAFRLVVAAEVGATIVLWIGTLALLGALIGVTAVETARALALLGGLMFTAVWAGFLIVGNYFCYWFSHAESQNTHYQMTLWGLVNMILLTAS